MKRHLPSLYIILAACTLLSGCIATLPSSPPPATIPEVDTPDRPLASPATAKAALTPPPEITCEAPTRVFLEEVGLHLRIPCPYTTVTTKEQGRRGSVASYSFIPYFERLPGLDEIQFFTEQSIRDFNNQVCEIGYCFEGDYPDVERYTRQRQWFESGLSPTYGDPVAIGGETFLVTNIPIPDCNCHIREYTTFIEALKVDIWVVVSDVGPDSEGDDLVAGIGIEE